MEVEKLSATRINTYTQCGMRFYFRYVCGEKVMPTGAMLLGSAFHDSIGYNYEQKIETFQDLPAQAVLDHFSTDYDVGKQDARWMSDEEPGKIKDTGINLLSHYHKIVAPDVQPIGVEYGFNLQLKEYEFPIEGYIDCIEDDLTITETKTIKSKPRRPSFQHILQASLYTVGFRARGVREKGVRFDYAVKTKTPQIVKFPYQVELSDLVFVKYMIDKVKTGIEKEHWIPDRTLNTCTRKWCGFWALCEEECGGRIPD